MYDRQRMPSLSPKMIIIAGPNGSGKTTFGKEYLRKLKIKNFLNSDEIARGLSIVDPQSHEQEAGKILLRQLSKYISNRENFAIETTLSGRTLEKHIRKAKSRGYEIHLIYLHTDDVRINIKRIKNRKKEGGHFVPSEAVRRRYKRSLENLNSFARKICDTIEIYDALTMPPQLMEFINLRENIWFKIPGSHVDIYEGKK